MLNIALIFPLKYRKFYINPFYLQKVEGLLLEAFSADQIKTVLLDKNTDDYYQLLNSSSPYDLILLDTPAGEIESVTSVLNEIDTKSALLIGETIKYGCAKALLQDLQKDYTFQILGCSDDNGILEYIRTMVNGDIRNGIPGLMYFEQDIFYENPVDPKKDYQKHLLLNFEDNIIKCYEKTGIQIFMEGISNGCENQCSFCKLNNSTVISRKVVPSCINIADTLSLLEKKCKKKLFIQFTDENFFGGGMNRLNAVKKLCSELKVINYKGKFGIDTRLDSIINTSDSTVKQQERERIWKMFSSCGLKYCFLGLETFHQNQAKRYHKNLDLTNFHKAIAFLEENNIIYTIGLILWDPLMNVQELESNLDFIYHNNLFGKTASLLKKMRIQANSIYFKENIFKENIFKDEIIYHADDYFNINEEDIVYHDQTIQGILPYVDSVYKLFDGCGYRHSDVTLFSALYDESTPDILKHIPYKISVLEFVILKYLLKNEDLSDESKVKNEISRLCIETVSDIHHSLDSLNDIAEYDLELQSIITYYQTVFSKIYIRLKDFL